MRLAPPIATLAVLAGASACEEPYDIGVDAPIAHVVIDARLRSGSSPVVAVRAVDVYGDPAAGAPVDDSYVALETSDGLTFELELVPEEGTADSLAVFSTPDRQDIVVVGVTYRLRVETPGFARLRSQTTVPPRAGITFAAQRPDSSEFEAVSYDSLSGNLSLAFSIDDAGPGTNFYHVIVSAQDSTRSLAMPFAFARNVSDVENLGARGIFISDKGFPKGNFDNRILVDREALRSFGASQVKVEVRVVSAPYYDYVVDGGLISAGSSSQLPTGRTQSEGNISGGRGVFASYSASESIYSLNR